MSPWKPPCPASAANFIEEQFLVKMRFNNQTKLKKNPKKIDELLVSHHSNYIPVLIKSCCT